MYVCWLLQYDCLVPSSSRSLEDRDEGSDGKGRNKVLYMNDLRRIEHKIYKSAKFKVKIKKIVNVTKHFST